MKAVMESEQFEIPIGCEASLSLPGAFDPNPVSTSKSLSWCLGEQTQWSGRQELPRNIICRLYLNSSVGEVTATVG